MAIIEQTTFRGHSVPRTQRLLEIGKEVVLEDRGYGPTRLLKRVQATSPDSVALKVNIENPEPTIIRLEGAGDIATHKSALETRPNKLGFAKTIFAYNNAKI